MIGYMNVLSVVPNVASNGNSKNTDNLVDGESHKFWKFKTTVTFKAQGIYDISSKEKDLNSLIIKKITKPIRRKRMH